MPQNAHMHATTQGAAAGTAISPGWGTAIGAGLGMASSFLDSSGGSYRARNRDLRKQYKYQERYLPRIQSAQFKQKMQDVDAAGLHRLAALGIAPGGGGSAPMSPIIPGQSNFGSSVADGINTGMQIYGKTKANAHAQTIAGLQVKDAELRLDWLETQIANQKLKNAQLLANSTQDGEKFQTGQTIHNPQDVINLMGNKFPTANMPNAEDIEKLYSEWANLYAPIKMAADLGHNINKRTNLGPRVLEAYRKQRGDLARKINSYWEKSKNYRSSPSNPYRGMGKTNF